MGTVHEGWKFDRGYHKSEAGLSRGRYRSGGPEAKGDFVDDCCRVTHWARVSAIPLPTLTTTGSLLLTTSFDHPHLSFLPPTLLLLQTHIYIYIRMRSKFKDEHPFGS